MTYLSLVPVHELRRSSRVFDNPDTRHHEVMELFGTLAPGSPRSEAGILFRMDTVDWQEYPAADGSIRSGKVPAYLVRSKIPPEFAKPTMLTREESTEFLASGMSIQFRIAVNGVERVDRDKARPTRLDGQEPRDENDHSLSISQWLAKRLAGALAEVTINSHEREVIGGRRSGSTKVVQIDTIDGVATIENVNRLRELLENGVGRAKNYGCGLLTIKAL